MSAIGGLILLHLRRLKELVEHNPEVEWDEAREYVDTFDKIHNHAFYRRCMVRSKRYEDEPNELRSEAS